MPKYTNSEHATIERAWIQLHYMLGYQHRYTWNLDEALKDARNDGEPKRSLAFCKAVLIREFLHGYKKPKIKAYELFELARWAQRAIMVGANFKERVPPQGIRPEIFKLLHKAVRAHDAATDRQFIAWKFS